MFTNKAKNLSSGLTKGKKIKFSKLLLLFVIVVAIGGIAASVYYYERYQSLKSNPNLEAQKETESLVATVGKIMDLPTNETPTVATIADKDKLNDQAFFKNAQNGDKLLAFTKAMQAILYRPSANKIIAVAPIVINNNENTTTATVTSTDLPTEQTETPQN